MVDVGEGGAILVDLKTKTLALSACGKRLSQKTKPDASPYLRGAVMQATKGQPEALFNLRRARAQLGGCTLSRRDRLEEIRRPEGRRSAWKLLF